MRIVMCAQYPDKTMHITNELIHNPGVNELLQGMDIKFLEKDESAMGKRFDTIGDGDVVILPAFGASLEEMQYLDNKGVTTVDTTCPWVSKVRSSCSSVARHAPRAAHCLPTTDHNSPLTAHRPPLTAHHSPPTAHRSLTR